MSPITTRIFLGLSLILSATVAGVALFALDSPSSPAWATLAAALAVVTSMISAWGAQRVVELEEAKLQPYPYPHFDTTSRYGLMLLRVTNAGGGVAHEVDLKWDSPLTNSEGKEVKFAPQRIAPQIPVLMPGQSVATKVDGHLQFFGMERKHEYSGIVHFKDGRGKSRSHRFVLDAEMFRSTPYYEEEELKTHHEVQRLPEVLTNIERELAGVRCVLEAKANEA